MANEALMLGLVEQVVLDLVQQIQVAKLEKPGSEDKLYKQLNNILTQFGVSIGQVLPQEIILAYFGGVDEATAQLAAVDATIPPTLSITEAGLIAAPMQKPIHMNALEKLIDDSMADMGAAIRTAAESGKFTIDRTLSKVRGEIAKGQIVGQTQKKTTAAVMKAFREDGMTSFITSDGKKLPLSFYAMTVNRTKTRSATVQGTVNRFVDANKDLVRIQGNGDSCKICSAFNGLVISISGNTEGYIALGGAVRLPPFHPNCRCAVRLFDPKFESEADVELAKLQGREFDPEKDYRTKEQREAYEDEQRKRRIANEEMKQFMRWQAELGAEAPKTLGAFRRMKRQNTVQFQQLQSEVRSRAMTKSWENRKLPGAAADLKEQALQAERVKVAAAAQSEWDKAVEAAQKQIEAERKLAEEVVPTFEPPSAAVDTKGYYRARPAEMKQIGEDLYAGFHRADRDAYGSYVANGNSFSMNSFLYKGKYEKFNADDYDPDDISLDDGEVMEEIDALSKLIGKHKIPEKMRAYRMVDNDFLDVVMKSVGLENDEYFEPYRKSTHEPFLEKAKGSLTGVRFTNKSFMSTSYDPGQNVFTERPLRMELLVDEGQKGLITKNHFESEVVFDKDTELEFIDFEILEDDDDKPFFNILTRIIK